MADEHSDVAPRPPVARGLTDPGRVLAAGLAGRRSHPARLGQVTIKAKEFRQYGAKGGRLDILAYDAALDTYYEVEIMLGECDADRGFRALDYWARERVRNPNARHVAVIVAEDLSGRYRTVIETLAQHLPLIAIEIRTLLVKSDLPVATTFPIIVAQRCWCVEAV